MTPMDHIERAARDIIRDPDQFKKPDMVVHLLRQAYCLGALDGQDNWNSLQVGDDDPAWDAIEAEAPSEPPFDENHHRYHTPRGPNPACANCKYLHWSQA